MRPFVLLIQSRWRRRWDVNVGCNIGLCKQIKIIRRRINGLCVQPLVNDESSTYGFGGSINFDEIAGSYASRKQKRGRVWSFGKGALCRTVLHCGRGHQRVVVEGAER